MRARVLLCGGALLTCASLAFADHPSVPIGTKTEAVEQSADGRSDEDVDPHPMIKPTRPDGALVVKGDPAPANEGHYQGVVPGSDRLPPHAPKPGITKGPQRLVWTGFQVRNGVPTLFLEFTGTVEYRVEEQAGATVVHLDSATPAARNNLRPLRASYFDAPITDVDLKQLGKSSLEVRIKPRGKGPVAHKERWEAAAGGYQMLLVEFPSSNP